jgi:hypothetical protein
MESMVKQYTQTPKLSLIRSPDLGADASIYRNRLYPWRRALAFLMIWMLSVLLVAGFTLGYLISQEYFSPFRAVDPRIIPLLAIISAATLVFWLILVLRYRQSSDFLEITQQSLHFHLPGSRSKSIKWDEIEAIAVDVVETRFLWFHSRERWQASVYIRQGRAIVLNSRIERLPEAISRIKAAVFPRLLNTYRQELSAGGKIKFGPLLVEPEHLQINQGRLRSSTIPWNQVATLKIENGRLHILLARGKNHSLPVKYIPNLELLLEIVKQDLRL